MATKENDATACDKILQLYDLLLFSGRAYSHTELAQKFECSKPTITRYIALFDARFPNMLQREKDGNRFFYRFINSRTYRANVGLNNEELRLLSMAKAFTSPLAENEKEMLSLAIDKIINVFQDKNLEEESQIDLPIFSSLSGRIRYDNNNAIISKIMRAIKNKQVCLIERTNGKKSEAAFTQLLVRNNALYAQGYFVTEMGKPEIVAPASYYVHRIKDIILTKRTHDFKQSDENSKNLGVREGEKIKAEIHFTGYAIEYVKDRIYSDDQDFKDLEDGSCILCLTVNNKYELKSFVLSFGSQACLISPTDIREEIKADLERNLGQYS